MVSGLQTSDQTFAHSGLIAGWEPDWPWEVRICAISAINAWNGADVPRANACSRVRDSRFERVCVARR